MPNIRGVTQTSSGAAVTSFSVNKPAGTASGDVMFLFHVANINGDTDTLATPTGGATWTLVATVGLYSGSFCVGKLWRKTAGGSEPSSYSLGQGSSDGVATVISLYEAATTAPVTANSQS